MKTKFLKKNSSNKELKFFRSIPRGSYIILMLCIFCLFAILGFVTSLFIPGQFGYWSVILSAISSGLISVAYAHAVVRDRRFFIIAIPLQLLISYAMPTNPAPVSMSSITKEYLIFHASGIMLLIVLSYTLLIKFIGKEGLSHYRMRTEIDLAEKLHSILVPPVSLHFGSYEIYGISKPVGEVGGDMFDCYTNGSGGITVTIADVSGHGVGAGALVGMFKSSLRTILPSGGNISENLSLVNKTLFELKEKKMFITAAMAELYEGTINYTVAGHPPILIYRRESGKIEEKTIKQIPVGVRKDFKFTHETDSIANGDIVLMLTDGVMETFSKSGGQFGLKRVEELLKTNYNSSAEEIAKKLTDEVENFGVLTDDVTVVVIKRN
ncbi:MAG: serine/threonine-protein phosphatase [Ignavibacteriales bacterium]|nr:hypothetical protein [Ignavibacteriaceae bacterium]MBW7874288.1 serine/threonine-protein phosphatase [Ignavibacteria bacterium]MCZ2142668.1 serine/threonine-protein phosphatase [Ignavibacteriales bacterium]OQY73475.1 MAG: hypothetical protein B6D45_08115 [Ignavibacteriales bacterium UTCHB3]WKZ71567.1 MAG: PP2C family protein-serine/threonine phosphatase [Ignavibacteriaceae bacterium]